MTPTSVKIAALVATLIISCVECVPKYDHGGFVSSSLGYSDKSAKSRDQMAMPSQAHPRNNNVSITSRTSESNIAAERNQEPRFGYSGVSGGGSGYGISSYAPTKMDLGGLVLGAVIGVGTILIIPKLLYIISGSYGAYARSDDDDGGFVNSMTKLDDILARYGVDTTTCMQRAVCTYAKKASETIRNANDINDDEKISSFDRMIESLTTNQVFRTAMRGTAIQEAVESGRKGQNCSRLYRQCGFSIESVAGFLSNLISSATNADAVPTAPAAPL